MTESLIADAIEFACHAASCAPPPVGKGGSVRGKVSRAQRISDLQTRDKAMRAYATAKKAGDKAGMLKHATTYRRARNRVTDNKTRDGFRSSVGSPGNGPKVRRNTSAMAQRSLRKTATTAQKRLNDRVLPND